ncbi:SDR family NAD(P)-dependent oxidoreductase [Qipengyuania qiaonensis]|uniref:SDR family oxidoreductase n=1 Tax=Qipengyuania qiaonensis TaxID=2867240 RepID=A0ABS7JEC3_9SPHN|nr:SDR family oxidoreductase [Qipengyuania qiaonensis]MBX7484033.1 SDR family oxidoreductase [Qipengyuania qiaonensis]
MTDVSRRNALGAGLVGMAAVAVPRGAAKAQSSNQPQGRFASKSVIITGATSGIGRASAEAFAREGAKVAFCGRRQELGREVEAGLRRLGAPDAYYVPADVREPDQVRRFVDGTAERFGGIEIALNNAGINWFKPLHEISLEDWTDMQDTNFRGVFLAMKHQIPHMLRGGGGRIVVTASMHDRATRPGGAAYASSKRAVLSLVQAAAMDYGEQNIRVNAVSPGIIDTRLYRAGADTPQRRADAAASVDGLKRVGTPEEMAGAILFLASDQCTYLTGATLLADGGLMAGI